LCWLQDLSSDLRVDVVLDKTIENALQALPGCEFALLRTRKGRLRAIRTSGLEPPVRRRLEAWAGSRPRLATESHAIDAMSADPELAAIAARLRLGGLRAEPLVFKGRSLGSLVTLTPADRPFASHDRELLVAFVEQAALALANAHLFQTLVENATQDSLTGLPNRREFQRLLARELQRSSRYGEIFSLSIIDLDQFKQLNDSRGHAAGDALLRQAADTIQEVCRSSDVAGRLGGDEFALLLPETNQFEAAALCERLRAEIETLAEVSLSWGVAEYPTHGVTARALLTTADAAMYASKPQLLGGERSARRAAAR
jgi:diguanylate cyclase (GGDEF)-like protein